MSRRGRSWCATLTRVSCRTVYVGGVDNYVYALDGTRGFVKWQYLTRGRVHSGATVSSDGSMVYIGADDSTVYAISTAQVPQDGSAHAAVALLLLPDGASGWVGLVMVVASLLLLMHCCSSCESACWVFVQTDALCSRRRARQCGRRRRAARSTHHRLCRRTARRCTLAATTTACTPCPLPRVQCSGRSPPSRSVD